MRTAEEIQERIKKCEKDIEVYEHRLDIRVGKPCYHDESNRIKAFEEHIMNLEDYIQLLNWVLGESES